MKTAEKIFVFGSNLGGRHGKGAALAARTHHGAIYGQAEGLQGRSYAIPTKTAALTSLPLYVIAAGVARFLEFARSRPDLEFFVTPVGTGLAGYTVAQIAPMFAEVPVNVELPPAFKASLSSANSTPAGQ